MDWQNFYNLTYTSFENQFHKFNQGFTTDFYSDLLMSIGTHDSDRPFTPIEVSDLIVRLKEETGEDITNNVELKKYLGKNS